MFLLIALIAALVLLFIFRKQVWAWLKSPSDPLSVQLNEAVAKESAVFGKREVPPASPAASEKPQIGPKP